MEHYPNLSASRLEEVFRLLNGRLSFNNAPPVEMVVCGGAAMIVTGLLRRTTKDVDIVALVDSVSRKLVPPVPMPEWLLQAAHEVAEVLQLPEDWLNNGPSRDEGGLFQMGLPDGFQERLHSRVYGEHLTVHVIDRFDQIHFKLYAAVDRGGYHISDLEALHPTTEELVEAAHWACTHDVSAGFLMLLKHLLHELGYEDVASQL